MAIGSKGGETRSLRRLLDHPHHWRCIVTRTAFLANMAAIAAALVPATAMAQGGPPAATHGGPSGGPPGNTDTVTVGLGIGVTTSYDGAKAYKLIPGGTLRGTIAGHDFQLNGLQIFVDAIPNDPARAIDIEFGPVAGVGTNRTGDVSDERVDALGELDVAIELGVRGAIGKRGLLNRTDKLALAVTAVWDVAGAHDSYVISPAIEYSTLAGRRTFLRMAVISEFVGDEYARYNFGITPAGSLASGLATYEPGGGLASIGANVLATYSLSGKRTGWALFGIASYKRLQGDIAASPIVTETGSPNQFFASVGVGYTF
jgi:outer membrane protein